MFNRKICLLLVFLLFILHISFVCASEYNETDIVEINDNDELSVNNNACEKDDMVVLSENVLDFNQGDKIPVTIDSPVDGDLTVLVDGEIYKSWSFSKNKTVIIPTYNPDSFYDNTIKNINVGTHKLSLIFKLNTYNNYIPIVSNKDSNLTFKFNTANNTLNNKYTYSYTSTLNIHEKEKTIRLFFDDDAIYLTYSSLICYIELDNIDITNLIHDDFNFITGYVIGIIISDDKGIIFKKHDDIGEFVNLMSEFDEYGKPYTHGEYIEDVPGIDYDVVRKLGVCNLTVINFEDGTQDSVLFNVSKFSKFHDVLDFEIIDSNFIVSFYYWRFPDVYITIDNMNKVISPKGHYCNTTFNLNPGVHVMTLHCPESDFTEDFTYKLTFLIEGTVEMPISNSTIPELYVNNYTPVILFGLYDGSILGFDLLDSGYAVLTSDLLYETNEKSTSFGNINFNGKFQIGGDNKGASSSLSKDSSSGKSYEISKHISEPNDNLLTKLGLTIITCMSLMVGYFRFEKNQ